MEAVLAGVAISEEEGIGTHEPEIVQRLYHRNSLRPRGMVGSWRDQRKRIVKVGDQGPTTPEEAP